MKKSFATSNAWMLSSSVRDYPLLFTTSGLRPRTRSATFDSSTNILSAVDTVHSTDLSATLRGIDVQDVALYLLAFAIFDIMTVIVDW